MKVCHYAICLVALVLLSCASVQAQPSAPPNSALRWDYVDADLATGPVTMFLVCLDGQATSACASVPIAVGVVSPTVGQKTYEWKLPALVPGPHTASVQACTAAAAACSSGVPLAFNVVVIANPLNLRLGRAGG